MKRVVVPSQANNEGPIPFTLTTEFTFLQRPSQKWISPSYASFIFRDKK